MNGEAQTAATLPSPNPDDFSPHDDYGITTRSANLLPMVDLVGESESGAEGSVFGMKFMQRAKLRQQAAHQDILRQMDEDTEEWRSKLAKSRGGEEEVEDLGEESDEDRPQTQTQKLLHQAMAMATATAKATKKASPKTAPPAPTATAGRKRFAANPSANQSPSRVQGQDQNQDRQAQDQDETHSSDLPSTQATTTTTHGFAVSLSGPLTFNLSKTAASGMYVWWIGGFWDFREIKLVFATVPFCRARRMGEHHEEEGHSYDLNGKLSTSKRSSVRKDVKMAEEKKNKEEKKKTEAQIGETQAHAVANPWLQPNSAEPFDSPQSDKETKAIPSKSKTKAKAKRSDDKVRVDLAKMKETLLAREETSYTTLYPSRYHPLV